MKKAAAIILSLAIPVAVLFAVIHRAGELAAHEHAHDGETPCGYETVTVHSGDTLWGISEGYCPEYMDIREYISDLMRRNGIGAEIYPGQIIEVPIYNE